MERHFLTTMHEYPLVQSMLDVAIDAAQRAGAARITRITLLVGNLSSFLDESIQFYFDLLSANTIAAGAQIHFEREPGRAHCWQCGHEFCVAAPLPDACPQCQGTRLSISGGRDCRIESIETETETP